jgi:hypothetical protein
MVSKSKFDISWLNIATRDQKVKAPVYGAGSP